MINVNHLLKVNAAWISIVYVVCFAGAGMFSGMRPGLMMHGWHMSGYAGQNVLTFNTFLSGLVIWNVVAFLAVWLFAALYNGIKK
ncbi:MAG: hypothetical protein A2660_00125 [Candidatus Doudnabacteria bacterium RIFCSPHIGHO2_01_FULL_45_18]|uniref:Cytochrome oxidase subunit I profile domain-containing protein n=1 Tax=Candidatus Doudnabacteria bacterium RIFCSPHIGHO2_01_FULL_45_18 TaxID=1817823 RepID=A0A1F5NSB0_9BACT|nr:MAG: hypothetical protein A2660_00125 [Candidatus Doudnabacteria bacterium RIFCSPHIGHO2_01_FULL_45_18]